MPVHLSAAPTPKAAEETKTPNEAPIRYEPIEPINYEKLMESIQGANMQHPYSNSRNAYVRLIQIEPKLIGPNSTHQLEATKPTKTEKSE